MKTSPETHWKEVQNKIDAHNQTVLAELPKFFKNWIQMLLNALGPTDQIPKKES